MTLPVWLEWPEEHAVIVCDDRGFKRTYEWQGPKDALVPISWLYDGTIEIDVPPFTPDELPWKLRKVAESPQWKYNWYTRVDD